MSWHERSLLYRIVSMADSGRPMRLAPPTASGMESPAVRATQRFARRKQAKARLVARTQIGESVLRQAHPILRQAHQITAATTKQVPSGSGVRNAPQTARAAGDLISISFVILQPR
jgi:hypothetical protein